MDWQIIPHVGVGPLRFGMSREQVRAAVAAKYSIEKHSLGQFESDFFRDLGMFVCYREGYLCDAVEFGGPLSPTLEGQHLLGYSLDSAIQWIRGTDPALKTDSTGMTSFALGLGLYVGDADAGPDVPIEGVIVFAEGYYSRGPTGNQD